MIRPKEKKKKKKKKEGGKKERNRQARKGGPSQSRPFRHITKQQTRRRMEREWRCALP
jgi:hypothetical protein